MNHKTYKKVTLVILDGFGVAPHRPGNAISRAKTPTLNYIVSNFPAMTLQASGPLVGLPWAEMGNSEVGHLNIGAGRIVGQDLPRISTAIQKGDFFTNPALLGAIDHAKKNNSALHIMGMISPGGVHSFDEHAYALLGLAEKQGLKKVYIHMFTDGRDTAPKIATETLGKLSQKIKDSGVGKVATITGRFYAMDRGGHWGQTMQTYDALVSGKGETGTSAEEVIQKNYKAQIFDEMIKPTVIVEANGQPVGKISDNDAVIFFNFRSDRTLQLTRAFVAPPDDLPKEFKRDLLKNLYFATMTEYAPGLPVHVGFGKIELKNNLAELLSDKQLSQFHIAESEKFAHVTSFFNCGRIEKYPNEERIIITSPENNSSNYLDRPQMSAEALTKILVQRINESQTNFLLANYANCDIIGHTGDMNASVTAVEFIDGCLKMVMEACLSADSVLIITADHGNIEQMVNPKTGDIDKDHSTNPVPFLLIANEFKFNKTFEREYTYLSSLVPAGVICDVAPTILNLLGLEKPVEMTGINLLDEME